MLWLWETQCTFTVIPQLWPAEHTSCTKLLMLWAKKKIIFPSLYLFPLFQSLPNSPLTNLKFLFFFWSPSYFPPPPPLFFQFSSAPQSFLTLCNPIDCNTPGFPVLHQLLELGQTHIHWSVMPSTHLILCRPLLLLPSVFPSIRVFSNELVLFFFFFHLFLLVRG